MPEQQVFISYSHVDEMWLERLQTHLKPYLRSGSVRSWSDQEIVPSSKWFEEIRAALTHAKVAVLLVTPDFLASDFIHEHELGPLLKEAEQGGVKILWVPVRESAYKRTPLKDYQPVLNPSTPLAAMDEAKRDQAWVKICDEIEKAVSVYSQTLPQNLSTDAGTHGLERSASAPPSDRKQTTSVKHPALQRLYRRNVLLVIGGIVAVIIVGTVIRVPVPQNVNHPIGEVKNQVNIGDKFYLRSGDDRYVVTAEISKYNWPRLGTEGKVVLTFLGNGSLRDGSLVQIKSLEQNLNGNDVLGAFSDSHECYYWKGTADEKRQWWKISKRDASNPELHYGDKFNLLNVYDENRLLTGNNQALTVDEGIDWWWVLEKS
jgi:hypothetical protein